MGNEDLCAVCTRPEKRQVDMILKGVKKKEEKTSTPIDTESVMCYNTGRFQEDKGSSRNTDNNKDKKGKQTMNDKSDQILESIAGAIGDGCFESVEYVPGCIYIEEDGVQYAVSIMQCEPYEDSTDGGDDGDGDVEEVRMQKFSPFKKMKVTAKVDWDGDEGDELPDPDFEVTFTADELKNANNCLEEDKDDPMVWNFYTDDFEEWFGEYLTSYTDFCHNGFTYTIQPLNK